MGNIHVNRQVFDAVQQAIQQGDTQGGRPKIDATEVDKIEAAIIADGDISRDESLLLSSLKYQQSFVLIHGSESAEIDPLEVRFPSRDDVQTSRELEGSAIAKLELIQSTTAASDASPEKLIADVQSVFDGAAMALDAGEGERAAQILTGMAQTLRQASHSAQNPEKYILQELSHNMEARAGAYRQSDPDAARAAAGSLNLYARNARVISEGLVESHPEYSSLLQEVSQDSHFQAELIDQTAANTKSMLGMAVSQTYRSIVDASFAHDIADTGDIYNFFTGSRDELEADRTKMTEVFNFIDNKMQAEGLTFHEAWHDMFNDSHMASSSELPNFATPKMAAMFLRDHEVSRGLLIPLDDLSEGLSSGDASKVDAARGKLVEALRENDQWNLAREVLDDYQENASTAAGQSDAERLNDNESGEWWKAKAIQFAQEDLPILILSGVLSGGAGLGVKALTSAAGWSTRAVRIAQVSTEIAAFVPTERVLNDGINGRRADWSGRAMARDYALTLGGYGLAKALGAGWTALRGRAISGVKPPTTPKPGPQVQAMEPTHVGFSQNTVSFSKVDRATGQKFTFDDLVSSMKRDGWKGDPVDVVVMRDGVSTSMDNTRILAARHAGIKVQARVRAFDEPLTQAEKLRFTRQGSPTPNTWGEAIQIRVNAQQGVYSGSTFGDIFPNGTLFDPKVIKR